jgi:UDP-N-acetylenolpyruvoylglucosamine reductase
LIIVNHGSASGQEIANLANEVRIKVFEEFGVQLEPVLVLVDFPASQ